MQSRLTIALGALLAAGCGQQQPAATNTTNQVIKVRSNEQDQLHRLDALNLAIALKRAIYDAGYSCKRITDAGFVAEYKNLDMWVARCVYDKGSPRDWAIFAGPDGSAQVRDCKDVPGTGLPECAIRQRPKGSFGLGG
ncbi:MAG TPA: hypothetical protein VFP57_06735 [Sphingomicrobium sp.]|jgi:hypothetical protein|nr:hypothetical protein [Sphingomicrobium sp.]